MTEEEAKTKICPPSLSVGSPGMPCCGSGCMAWRRDGQHSIDPKDNSKLVDDGYCGLAGKP